MKKLYALGAFLLLTTLLLVVVLATGDSDRDQVSARNQQEVAALAEEPVAAADGEKAVSGGCCGSKPADKEKKTLSWLRPRPLPWCQAANCPENYQTCYTGGCFGVPVNCATQEGGCQGGGCSCPLVCPRFFIGVCADDYFCGGVDENGDCKLPEPSP